MHRVLNLKYDVLSIHVFEACTACHLFLIVVIGQTAIFVQKNPNSNTFSVIDVNRRDVDRIDIKGAWARNYVYIVAER